MEDLISYLRAVKGQLYSRPGFAKRIEQLLEARERGQNIEEDCYQLADDMETYGRNNIGKSNVILLLLFSSKIKGHLGPTKTIG